MQIGRYKAGAGTLTIAGATLVLGFALGLSLTRHQDGSAAGGVAGAASPAPASADMAQWRAEGEAAFADGRYDAAVAAYDKATRASPATAVLWSALGEARVLASQADPLPAEALGDFHRALAIDRQDPRARYFLAVRRDLDGDHQGAIADWLALLADTPQGAAWEADLRRTIAQVGAINHIVVAPRLAAIHQPRSGIAAAGADIGADGGAMTENAADLPIAARAIPGPSAQDLSDAARIPPSQQQALARAMVERLDARLTREPGDINGWVMLMRSRQTLGEPDKARAALARAIAANPAQAAALNQQARVLGLR